jgi:hypothetical protein
LKFVAKERREIEKDEDWEGERGKKLVAMERRKIEDED